MIKTIKVTVMRLFYLIAIVCLLSHRAYSHPHNWIDLKTEFIVDEKGQLVELRQFWMFDVFYSKITLEEMGDNNLPHEFSNIASEMVGNLKEYQYFSEFSLGKQSIQLPKPNDYSLSQIINDGQPQLVLSMRFTFKNGLIIKDRTLTLRIFDPSYYIDVKYNNAADVSISNNSKMTCSKDIESPEPTADIIEYATSLDRSQKNTKGLGQYFADIVRVNCI